MTLDYKHDRWINATGVLDGHNVHVRKNLSLRLDEAPAFPYLVLVSLLYREENHDGTPADEDELSCLDRTEEAIADVLQPRYEARFALCVTGAGSRDLFFFMAEAPDEDAVEQLLEGVAPEVDYSFEVLHDPAWQPYRDIPGDSFVER